MTILIRKIIYSSLLLFGATFLMFRMIMCASYIPMTSRVYLVPGEAKGSLTEDEEESLQQRIVDQVRKHDSGKILSDEELFELGSDMLRLQIASPDVWNQLKPKLVPRHIRMKVIRNPDAKIEYQLPTPLRYIKEIKDPLMFENLEFVRATAYYCQGNIQQVTDSYEEIVGWQDKLAAGRETWPNPIVSLAMVNLSSILISQKKKLPLVTKQLEWFILCQDDESSVTDLLKLRLGEVRIARSSFTRGARDFRKAIAGSNSFVSRQAQLHLTELQNRGLDVGYLGWLRRFVKGDLGRSVSTGRDIGVELRYRARKTLLLAAIAAAIAFAIAIILGSWAGSSPKSRLAQFSKSTVYLVSGIPVFLLGYLCLRWIHPKEGTVIYYGLASACLVFGNPFVSLMIQRLQQEISVFLTSDLAIAIKARQAKIIKHIIVNLVIPSVSTFVSQLPLFLSGAIVVETIFTYEGIGYWLLTAVKEKDLPVILPVCAILVLTVCLANIARDVVHVSIDPRLRS